MAGVFTVDWLHRAKCGHKDEPLGVVFWADAEYCLGGHRIWEYLRSIKQVKVDSELWRQTWDGLIRVSEDVCSYLADMLSGKTEPAKTERDTAPAKKEKNSNIINIQNSNVILGNVQQPENLQIGDRACINKNDGTKEKKKGIFRRIPYLIYILICFFAALLTCFYYLGWLEPIKEFIGKILWPK